MLVPGVGGQERILGECDPVWREFLVSDLAWTPDSKYLVFPVAEPGTPGKGIFLLSMETLQKRRLTTPPAGSAGDAAPALSPDGRTLVFTRVTGLGSDICFLRLGEHYEPQGSPETVGATGEQFNFNAVWTPDGREIVFCGGSYTQGSLWRVAVAKSAKPRKLTIPSEDVGAPAVSLHGNRLAYMVPKYNYGIWRIDLRDPRRKPGTPFRLIPSTRNESCPAYSPDGKRIAYASDRSGNLEIWACNSDGSNAVPVTSIGRGGAFGPRWSPDGQDIVFGEEFRDSIDIYVVSATGGPLRSLMSEQSGTTPWPFWSRDGKWIYFRSMRSGTSEIWKIPAAGREAAQITRNGGDQPQESPDGKFIYYVKADAYPTSCSVWRIPVGGGEETRILASTACGLPYAPREQGIYFFAKADEKGQSDVCFYEFATRSITKILNVGRPVSSIAVSPDGRTILWTQNDHSDTDLMLVEDFR